VRRPITVLVVAGALAWLLAPAGAAHRVGAASPLRLNVGTLGNIGSLDPRHGDSTIAREVWNLQYPTLTALDPRSLEAAPGLATAWSPAPGGRGWVYNLRPGLAWSDGQPLTAADVVYSLEHARDEHWPYASGMLDNLAARAVNARSIEVTSTSARGHDSFPGLLLHVVPAHVFEHNSDLESNVTQLGVSSGTWHVIATSPDSVELDATSAPTGPPVQQIAFRTYASADALISALAHKQADVISGVPNADIGRLEALSNVTVDHASDGTQYVLYDYFSDTRIRQAVSLAIDRTQLVAQAFAGVGTPDVVPVVALGASWSLDAATVQSLTASLDAQPDRARQLLAGASSSTRTLSFSTSKDPTSARVGALVSRSLAAVGVKTTAAPTDYAALDLSLQHLSIGADPAEGLRALVCDICAAKFRQYSSATDDTTQLDTAHEMLQRATAEAGVVGLFQPDTLQAFRTDKLTGFLPAPQQRSLVVFGPTVSQYSALSAAPPPPGEGSSNTTYAVGAIIVLALCAAAYAGAAWIRRRFAIPKETQ
jgi:peptide/nickel transport system substrate-binding protein